MADVRVKNCIRQPDYKLPKGMGDFPAINQHQSPQPNVDQK
jgi:hypothetical protein